MLVAEKRHAPTISRRSPAGRDGKLAANWVINELFGRLNREGKGIDAQPGRPPASSAAILDLIGEGEISGKIAKDLFEIVWTRGRRPARASSRRRGLKQVTDTGAIEAAVDEIIAANPDKAAQAQAEADARSAGSSAR